MRLTARDLSIGYDNRVVGSGISLTVVPGEVLCLLGPNGAGKTTLFRTLLGLQPPLAGNVAIDGEQLECGCGPPRSPSVIAYVPQAHVTEFSYSVLDMVLMGRTAQARSFASPGSEDRRDRARQARRASASPNSPSTTTPRFPAASANWF